MTKEDYSKNELTREGVYAGLDDQLTSEERFIERWFDGSRDDYFKWKQIKSLQDKLTTDSREGCYDERTE